jgi:hypothetical protein
MWNRCDYCGQFIAFKEFKEGGNAERHCITFETQQANGEWKSDEVYKTYHLECASPTYRINHEL